MNEEKTSSPEIVGGEIPSAPVLTEFPRYSPPPPPTAEVARTRAVPTLNIALFLLTLLTTTMAGAYMAGVERPLTSIVGLAQGLTFSVPLMAILLFHELGHYITARRNRVDSSLPYFIPAPYPSVFIIGTFGAFIRMKTPPRSRRVMFDVGAAGPWAGMLLAVPAVIIGLKLSEIAPLDKGAGGLELGNSILFWGLSRLILGLDPNSVTVNLHPIAFAGWIGLFVTALNLLPVGQLDGGHVVYALFGRRHRTISRSFIVVCLLMVVVPYLIGWAFWSGWLLWFVLLLILGVGHPSTVDADTPLEKPRRLAAWLTIALFIVTFIPVPLSFTPPSQSAPKGGTYDVSHPQPIRHRAPLRLAI
ncbi:MAG TPA: site-2 protease family protein [Candidatus Binataceae bacterium]|nr:site-2 protease family protein [Candidatus Binataceae bacterium]